MMAIPRRHLITELLSKLPFLAILIDFPWVIGHEIPDRMETRFQRDAEALGGMLKNCCGKPSYLLR
jgi:hypothetical protein